MKKGWRKAIAVDEAKVKPKNKTDIYLKCNSSEVVLAIHVSETRTTLDTIYILKKVLRRCENRTLTLVYKGPWYRFPLEKLGLDYKHHRFGKRNVMKQWHGLLKSFWKRFSYSLTLFAIWEVRNC